MSKRRVCFDLNVHVTLKRDVSLGVGWGLHSYGWGEGPADRPDPQAEAPAPGRASHTHILLHPEAGLQGRRSSGAA